MGSPSAVVLRAATPADLPELVEVQRAGAVLALAEVFPQDRYPFPVEAIRARWAAELADPAITASLVTDGADAVLGFAATRGDELLHFGTAVRTWGTGVAAQALAEVLRRLGLAGVTVARLWVFDGNARARRFYEKNGWTATSRRTRTSFAPYPVLLEYVRTLGSGS